MTEQLISCDRPTLRDLLINVMPLAAAKWYELGVLLLNPKYEYELNTIEADTRNDAATSCRKMFSKWLNTDELASWNKLKKALRIVQLNDVANDIELLLLQGDVSTDGPVVRSASRIEQKTAASGNIMDTKGSVTNSNQSSSCSRVAMKQPTPHSIAVESSSLISATSLNADFTSLLLDVRQILSNCPNHHDNLQACKEYCALLRISDNSNESLFSTENVAKIKECCNFEQLFEIICLHMSWDEHSILIQIVDRCKSVEGKQEIERFEKKIALYQGLQIIVDTSQEIVSEDFAQFCIVINKPYKNVTIEEYTKVKKFIFTNLKTHAYVTVGFIRMLYGSLHIEWLITVQAVPHMIRNAQKSLNIFIEENFVFMQIGLEIVINNKGEPGQTAMKGPFHSVEEAAKESEKKISQKTKNKWEDREQFTPAPQKYTLLKMDNEDDAFLNKSSQIKDISSVDVVDWLSGQVKEKYCSMRFRKYKEEEDSWPPIETKSYVTLSIVLQKEKQTSQEITEAIYLRTKGDIHEISYAKKLTGITQIFDPMSGRIPKSILIEGHAGIGKTILMKQICIEWAEGRLLTSNKLVLLLLLRDPNVRKITNIQEMIEYFTKSTSKVKQLFSYLKDNHGAGVTLIIDGFDELSTELRHQSFFKEMIEKKCLSEATIVVTSQPSASVSLHPMIDKRLKILGFEQSSRNQYVIDALQNSPAKLEKLQRHFQQYPSINAMCYIPLILSIIVFLCMCKPNELPPTASKLHASLILHIVCHYLKRVGKIAKDKIINTLEQLPPVVSETLQQLEKTAFNGLLMDKIVFTVEELPVLCKDDPTCYGLLQSTEWHNVKTVGIPTRSFNFLHLGMQEYFAAKNVTTLPEDKVDSLLKESFIGTGDIFYLIQWNSEVNPVNKYILLSNMWILYCGITNGRCKTLRHYLNTYSDPYQLLCSYLLKHKLLSHMGFNDDYLLRKYPRKILSMIYGHKLHNLMMNDSISSMILPYSSHDHAIKTSFFAKYFMTSTRQQINSGLDVQVVLEEMTGQSQKTPTSDQKITVSHDILKEPVRVLYLFQCFQEAQDYELCEVLSKSCDVYINLSCNTLLSHQVVSLGFFLSRSPRKLKELNLRWCLIGDHGISIIHQYLCGEETNKQEIAKIYLSENNLTEASSRLIADIIGHLRPHTLDLSFNNITNVRIISTAVINSCTIKVLKMSGNGISAQEAVAISDVMMCLEELKIYRIKLGDYGAKLLSDGMANTKTLKKLDIGDNNIGPLGTTAIANALAKNASLEELDMDSNEVRQDGAIAIAKGITNNNTLKTLSLRDKTIDKESAMKIISSLRCVIKLRLPYSLCDDNDIKREVIMNNKRRNRCNVPELVLD